MSLNVGLNKIMRNSILGRRRYRSDIVREQIKVRKCTIIRKITDTTMLVQVVNFFWISSFVRRRVKEGGIYIIRKVVIGIKHRPRTLSSGMYKIPTKWNLSVERTKKD